MSKLYRQNSRVDGMGSLRTNGQAMKVEIQSECQELNAALTDHIQRKVNMAFSRLEPRITEIVVRLSTARIAGNDARANCWLQVSIDTLGNVVVEDTQVDIFAAIDRAVQRAHRSVTRILAL